MSVGKGRFVAGRRAQFGIAVLCMLLVVVGSNILVQVPLNDWLTWGGLSYPVAFLVTDVLNRRFGPAAARRVVWFGFAAALAVSVWVASPRIALASGLAYICAQLVDMMRCATFGGDEHRPPGETRCPIRARRDPRGAQAAR